LVVCKVAKYAGRVSKQGYSANDFVVSTAKYVWIIIVLSSKP